MQRSAEKKKNHFHSRTGGNGENGEGAHFVLLRFLGFLLFRELLCETRRFSALSAVKDGCSLLGVVDRSELSSAASAASAVHQNQLGCGFAAPRISRFRPLRRLQAKRSNCGAVGACPSGGADGADGV